MKRPNEDIGMGKFLLILLVTAGILGILSGITADLKWENTSSALGMCAGVILVLFCLVIAGEAEDHQNKKKDQD